MKRAAVGTLVFFLVAPAVAAVATILGQALVLGRPLLLVYGAAVWATVASFVRRYEEPILERQSGSSYAWVAPC